MSDPFIGEIKMFGGNFAPVGWALCDGQLLPIATNSALFSILGTTFGGDGQTTFAVPDLRGRVPMHKGALNGGTPSYSLGQKTGEHEITLTEAQLPAHTHVLDVKLKGSSQRAREKEPANNSLAEGRDDIYKSDAPDVDMHPGSIAASAANTGGGNPINNLQPSLAVNYIIALTGVFPSQN